MTIAKGGSRKMKTKWRYMHLLDGKPAEYSPDGRTIFFRDTSVRNLARTLRQIRREQEVDRKWRQSVGLNCEASRYGYIRIWPVE